MTILKKPPLHNAVATFSGFLRCPCIGDQFSSDEAAVVGQDTCMKIDVVTIT
jgi:hypothetical protein